MSVDSPATYDYELPSLGADMDEGRVVEWKVAIGDTVHRGDVLASVETEKSDIDIEIWSDGVVEEFLVDLNEVVPVGTPVIRLRAEETADEATGTGELPAEPGAGPAEPGAVASEVPVPVAAAVDVPPSAGVRASPLARRTAVELGVDLRTVRGSGPNGAVLAGDLDRYREAAPAPDGGSDTPADRPVDRMRQLIADRMSTANREIPHYHLERQIDLAALLAWLELHNLDRAITERVLPAAAFIRAVALTASRHRAMNGWWIDGGFCEGDGVHVAMAVSLRAGGLVTPKIADTDQRSVDEIMAALRELVAASRSGSLRASWMTGSTITITNLGDQGADLVHGVISPPEVALVGFGRVVERPWVVDGELAVRPIVTATLAADHRATDGAVGSRFLATLAQLLEHPEEL